MYLASNSALLETNSSEACQQLGLTKPGERELFTSVTPEQ